MKATPIRTALKRGAQGPSKRAKKTTTYGDGNEAFCLQDDADKKKAEDENYVDEEEQETADQLRLRLAREYLSKVQDDMDEQDDQRGVTGISDDEGEDQADEDRSLDAAARAQRLSEQLQQDVAQAQGRLRWRLAARVRVLTLGDPSYTPPAVSRGHRLAATAVALTADDTTAFTVSKDGGICRWDMETMRRTQLYRPSDGPSTSSAPLGGGVPEWVARKARFGSRAALGAVAVSSDRRYLAVGGGDCLVHVFDAGSGTYVQGFPGHKDVVTGLAFRDGTHTLISCSGDRTLKLWSLADRAYMDTLYGHQGEVLGVDVGRAERVVSVGHDHTCRLWRIPEESQLIFRAHDRALDCVKLITSTEWLSGGCDGSLHLWSHLKKKPVFVARGAHGPGAAAVYGAAAVHSNGGVCGGQQQPMVVEHGWVTAVAACRNSDLVASGAGDGAIRLWSVAPGKSGGAGSLTCIGALPQRGFVNGLAFSRSGRFLVAAVGQEPRMGRWVRDSQARNGLALHRLGME